MCVCVWGGDVRVRLPVKALGTLHSSFCNVPQSCPNLRVWFFPMVTITKYEMCWISCQILELSQCKNSAIFAVVEKTSHPGYLITFSFSSHLHQAIDIAVWSFWLWCSSVKLDPVYLATILWLWFQSMLIRPSAKVKFPPCIFSRAARLTRK